MKKILLALGLAAVVVGRAQTANAGGWPIAAGVAGGFVAGAVISESLSCRPGYYVAPAPACYYPPVAVYPRAYCAPCPPVVIYGRGYGYGCRPGYARGYPHGYHYSGRR